MGPNNHQKASPIQRNDARAPTAVLALVEDAGNRNVLEEWIEGTDSFELVADASDPSTVSFDCLIADDRMYLEHRDWLLQRKKEASAVLPYVLLVEEREAQTVRSQLQDQHADLWESVNAVIEMPVSETELNDRLQTLAQTRTQSIDLLTQERELQTIRDEHAGHGVLITDQDGVIEYVNRAFETQSGYDQSEVLGKNPRILQSGVHDEEFYEDLWETICSGAVWQGEVTNEGKDGQQYVVSQTIAPVTDENGEIIRFIAVNHEVTALKELEISLRNQREQLAILNRVLRHDIRNDLHVLMGWSEALENHTNDEGREYLERILRSGEHIVELTEVAKDIADGVLVDEDQELKPIPLGKMLEEEVKKRQESFEEASIELLEEPDASTTVLANEMLSSVFRNLINNAVQHNDKAHPTVTISTKKIGDTVEVQVTDNGPGISDERKSEIFEEARKGLDSSGTGMGLFLVESLVSSYGGDIRVTDSESGGASFVFTLQCVDSGGPVEEGQ